MEDEAVRKGSNRQTWSGKTLQHNIFSQYYYRMLKTKTQKLCEIEYEMKELTSAYQEHRLEFIKKPVIAEIMDMPDEALFTEIDLEKSIITNLQKSLMELDKELRLCGKTTAYTHRKGRLLCGLVFYNYILKCFVMIDLKTNKITH